MTAGQKMPQSLGFTKALTQLIKAVKAAQEAKKLATQSQIYANVNQKLVEIWRVKAPEGKNISVLEFLRQYRWLPSSTEGARLARPSNAELRRWLKKGSVIINGKVVRANDKIEYPITELIFFKGSKSQTTIIKGA